MLVLSRKPGERIQIGDDVVITLTKIAGNRVTVGIDAPREVAIRRGELMLDEDESDSSPVLLGLDHDTNSRSGCVAEAS